MHHHNSIFNNLTLGSMPFSHVWTCWILYFTRSVHCTVDKAVLKCEQFFFWKILFIFHSNWSREFLFQIRFVANECGMAGKICSSEERKLYSNVTTLGKKLVFMWVTYVLWVGRPVRWFYGQRIRLWESLAKWIIFSVKSFKELFTTYLCH